MKGYFLLSVMVFQVIASAFAKDADAVVIDPAESRELIRGEILNYTPPGSTVDQVQRFIKEQLHIQKAATLRDSPASGPATVDSSKTGAKSIKIILGRFITNPLLLTLQIPLPLATDVSVQWAFDRDGKLLEVFVDKNLEGA